MNKMVEIGAKPDTDGLPEPVPHSTEVTEIRPSRGLFDLELRTFWRYRELLWVLVGRDLKVIYRQAAFGAAWAVIQPIFAVVIFTVVFGHFAKMPTNGLPYPIFAFAAVLPWTYFAEAVRRSSVGVVNEAELIRKVFFPRMVIPLVGVIAPMVDFAIGLVVLVVVMALYGIFPTWNFLAIPFLLLISAALALGMGLWLAPINVKFRDIKHTLPFLVQVWMYGTPIVYPLSIVPEEWRWAYNLNPMVGVIEGFRWATLDQAKPDLTAMATSGVIIVVMLAGGLLFFKKQERSFADVI